MSSEWTISTLKEYCDTKFDASKEAVAQALVSVKEENRKSEVAAEKRFDLLNELRSGVATKDEVRALEKVVEDLKTSRDTGVGKGMGYTQFIGWIVAAVTLIGFLIKNIKLN